MISYVHTADLHLDTSYPHDKTYHGESVRMNDTFSNFEAAVDWALEKDVEAFFIAGDVFNRPSIPKDLVVRFVRSLSPLVKDGVQVYIITGQHDMFSNGTTSLSLLREVLDEWGTTDLVTVIDNGWAKRELPWKKDVVVRSEPSYVWMVPFSADIKKHLKEAVEDVKATVAADKILLVHTAFTGSVVGSQEHVLVTQIDPQIAKHFDIVLAGDIHKRQRLGQKIYYPGSLIRQNFGERDYEVGFNWFDEDVKASPIKITLVDRLYVVIDINGDYDLERVEEGSIVKIDYHVGGSKTMHDVGLLEEELYNKRKVLNVIVNPILPDEDNMAGLPKNVKIGTTFEQAFDGYMEDIETELDKESIISFIKSLIK